MKILVLLVCLFAWANSHALADIQISYTDLVKLYGKPDEKNTSAVYGDGVVLGKRKYTFHSDDIVINVTANADTISSIEFNRDTPFSELEIGMILKPLSDQEDWVQSGKDWTLKDENTKAHWNGEGKITVQ